MSLPITLLAARAAELHEALLAGTDEAIARAAAGGLGTEGPFDLDDAKSIIAGEEGFERWHDLVEAVGTRMVEEHDLHRWFGVRLNNATWGRLADASVTPSSPVEDRENLLYAAYASTYHWMQAGSPINHARGEHLIARAAIRVGRPELGLHHATRCLEIAAAHPDLAEDWDLGFAHEAIARAHAALGSEELARAHRAEVEGIIAGMADDDDRAILAAELADGEWFDLVD